MTDIEKYQIVRETTDEIYQKVFKSIHSSIKAGEVNEDTAWMCLNKLRMVVDEIEHKNDKSLIVR